MRCLVWLRWPSAVCAVLLAVQVWYVGDRTHATTLNFPRPLVWVCEAGSIEVQFRRRFPSEASQGFWTGGIQDNSEEPVVVMPGAPETHSAWSGWSFKRDHHFFSFHQVSDQGQRLAAMTRRGVQLRFPAWPVCLGLAGYAVLGTGLWWVMRPKPGRCAQCGYPMPKAGVCPECGVVVGRG